MIKDIKELNFPAYATLQQATVTINDMGSRSISTQVQISGEIVPDFSYDWEVEFKGERYVHPVRKPQGTKENTSMSAKIDMVFQHWAIYEMKRQYFVEMASTSAGTAVADKYIASLGLNLVNFVTAFNLVLNHYFGGRIIIKLNPEWQSDPEAKFVSISYSYIWDVLQQIYDIYGVRWTIKTNAEGVCEILMGYPAEEASHIFEYGFEGGLLSVQRQVQSTEIRNRLLGRGGSKNLPYRYFKDKDSNNPLFEADPDWIPELANVAFTELRGKSFRDYVRGWKARHYDGNAMEEPTEAYLAGYNAEKFDPIEYVEDKDSIAKYGVLVGALQNNEDIYPSIQGAPGDVDMIVDAEQVTDDDVDSAVENDSVTTNLESGHQTYRNAPANSTVTIETLTKRYFSVPEGKVGNLSMSLTATGKYSDFGDYEETHPILKSDTVKVTIHDKITGAEVKLSSVPVVNIPAGDYYYMISAEVETNYDKTSMVTLNIESVHLYTSTPDESEGWRPTFDIWVRNIWGSSRNAGETDQKYADRVWLPILGDRMGNEARVVFASGWLSFSSDWEFPIVGYAYDDSKEGSHWRLTLAKSEAELEASGKYIPYEGYNASAGDRFFFIGIDMPYEYVIWAEERLDDFKRDSLMQTAEVNPAWVIKTDKVRLNQDREGAVLVDSLNAGSQIRLASKQFISGAYETLYVQSLTYKWTADTIMYPDVEVVVSDKAVVVKNPVAQIQSNIEAIQRQVGSMSNLQQIIRQICDKLYLRKDGISDVSKSPTKFLGKVTGENFRQGQIGGRDWGIYRDENGNAILEADKLVARQGILVTDLVVNEATYVGGLQIRSAAHMDVTSVEDAEAGYVCSFDQKQGSVTNKFTEDDVVLCQKFDADQSEVKFYKRRVVSVSETSVTLSKTDVNGTGVPAEGDVIIHYGNYTNKSRQFVIISDVIGGGYERMLMGLDSVASDGIEYYFAGKSADSKARWFVGSTEQYAKYENGQFTIKGNIFATGSDKPVNEQIADLDFIREAFGDGAQGLILGTAIIVGYNNDQGNFVPMAGMSGVFDKKSDNGGPAAWYGGSMENAMSMIFMDGTGYFADGLFKWDKNTGINLGDGQLKINYDGSVDFGGNIRIGSTGEETLDSLLTIVAKLSDLWTVDAADNLVAKKQVIVKNNLIVEGDSASGGTGGGSVVGATSVVVDGVSYPAKDGVIDMSEAFEGLQPEIDLSDYYTKGEVNELINGVTSGDIDLANYYTKSQIDDKFDAIDFSPYAKKTDVEGVETRVSTLEKAGYATKGYVDSSISSLVNGAPTTLDTLKEIADAFEESQDVIDALDKAIGTKASQTALDATTERVGSLESTLKTEQGNIDTLEGYFSSGIAKKATADAKGNVIDTYYTPIATHNAFKESTNASLALKATASDLSALAGRVTANEGSISSLQSGKADKATTLAGYGIGDAYTKTDIDAKVLTINNALALRYTKNEVDAIVETINDALDNRYTKAQTNSAISTALASYYTKNEIDGKVTTINDALADRYTKAQVDGIVTTINQSISSVDNKYAPTKTWADTLASLIVNENGNIRIKTNLIVNGDTASGGGSGSASVGISGIKLNGTTYRDENSDGIIDLGTITSGLTSVSWSDVKDRPTALSQFDNDLNLGSLAYKNGLTASDVGALSTSGGTISTNLTIQSGNDGKLILDNTDQDNKWNLIYFKQNGVEYGRLGTADSDNITWNGKHIYHSGNFTSSVITTALGYTPLSTAGGTISGSIDFVSGNAIKSNSQNVLVMYAGIDTYLYGSNNIYLSTPNLYHYTDSGVYKVLDSGNYSSYALPLSGGTISGASGALTIARTDADQIGILFKGKSGDLGFLGFGSSGTPAYINVSGTPYTLLHSGNYSDYALPLSGGLMVGAATIQWGNNQCGWDDVANGLIGMSILKDDPNYGYYAGLSFKGYYGFQIRNLAGGDTYQVRGHNSSQWGTWRTLIHSGNIGDYALKTDGSSKMQGSLNMGTSVIAWGVNNGLQYLGPNADGASLAFFGNGFSDWKTIAFTDSTVDKAKQLVHTNGSYIIYNSGSTFYVGDTIYPDVPTHILGKEVLLRYGASAAIGFILNSSGNVTIGAGDLAGSGGTKLFVDGNIFTSGGSIYRIEDSNIAYYGPAQNGIGANYDGALMYAYDSRPLYFYTGGIRMLINSSGNVLIGTTTDDGTNKLQVNGGISLMGRISSAVSLVFNGDYGIWKGNRFTGALTENDIAYNAAKHIFYNGNVGIGTTSPAHKLDVDGTGNFSVGVKANEVLLGSAGLYKGSYWSSSLSDNDMVISGGKISLSGAVTMSSTLSVSGTSTFNGDVRINGNLVVTGDTASGGSAGATSGGVSILTINGNIPVGSSISQSQLDAIGFTSEILADLMNGKYVYVKNIRSNGSFSLMTISANGGAIYMKEGSENFEMIEYVFYKSSSTTWRIEVYEV